MKLYELKERASLSSSLIEIWEASVRATHLFLSDAEIKHIKEYVLEALNAVGFYRHFGFETYKRTDCDEEGNPYPLLYMKLSAEKEKEK